MKAICRDVLLGLDYLHARKAGAVTLKRFDSQPESFVSLKCTLTPRKYTLNHPSVPKQAHNTPKHSLSPPLIPPTYTHKHPLPHKTCLR